MSAATERTALYRFFDANGALLYVGITKNFGQRWVSHAKKKPWWPKVQRHTAEWFDTRREAEAAEKQAVVSEGPKYNLVHKPRTPRAPVLRPTPPVKVLADPGADYWDIADVAAHWNVAPQSVRTYRSRGRGELPEPDRIFARTPTWKPATILNFQRPGQGARTDLRDEAKSTEDPPAPE
ncbi:GIY-YIG nuclease family protein [Streptomyces mirabilis]|uniref:GIY-YIG nuclease family protein n=1 Tax=Streptomyces mirabilis TaxID=68239 RepID=UPI00367A37CC